MFIWDEAPMMHRFTIEAVDMLFKDLTNSHLPFGGKIVILGGDFRQILPVIPRGTHADVFNATVVNSYLWSMFKKVRLTHNMRAHGHEDFSQFLLRIGDGQEPVIEDDLIVVPTKMVVPFLDEVSSLKTLVDQVFPNIHEWDNNYEGVVNRAILTPKNESVDAINDMIIESFPGEVVVYYSFDATIETTENTFQVDVLNTLTPNGVPPHELRLKLNSPIMLLRNLNSAEGLSNGTRLICLRFHKNLIEAQISVGPERGKMVFSPRIPFIPPETQQNPYSFKRTQFPVRLCFAMTINKAQGQTLDYVGLYLPQPVFSHGQLYVAFSRVRNKESLKILICPTTEKKYLYLTKNIVYVDMLQLAISV